MQKPCCTSSTVLFSVMLLFIIIVLIIRPSLWYSSDDWKLHVGWSLQERIPNWDQSWQPIANLVGWVRTTVGHLAEAGKEGFHVLLARYVHTINVKTHSIWSCLCVKVVSGNAMASCFLQISQELKVAFISAYSFGDQNRATIDSVSLIE